MQSVSKAYEQAKRDYNKLLLPYREPIAGSFIIAAITGLILGATTTPLFALAIISIPFVGLGLIFTGLFVNQLFKSAPSNTESSAPLSSSSTSADTVEYAPLSAKKSNTFSALLDGKHEDDGLIHERTSDDDNERSLSIDRNFVSQDNVITSLCGLFASTSTSTRERKDSSSSNESDGIDLRSVASQHDLTI